MCLLARLGKRLAWLIHRGPCFPFSLLKSRLFLFVPCATGFRHGFATAPFSYTLLKPEARPQGSVSHPYRLLKPYDIMRRRLRQARADGYPSEETVGAMGDSGDFT